MYILTCCRIGEWPKCNRMAKGCFKRKFETLSDMAAFIFSTNNLFYPRILKELSRKERDILGSKCNSIRVRNLEGRS